MDLSVIEDRKARARTWFEALRDDVCTAFERLEDEAPASLYPGDAGRFVRTPWDRTDAGGRPGGGGVTSILHGRVFEKVGVIARRSGEFPRNSASRFPAPRTTRASGQRHFARHPYAHAAGAGSAYEYALHRDDKDWFGGGSDLTPI